MQVGNNWVGLRARRLRTEHGVRFLGQRDAGPLFLFVSHSGYLKQGLATEFGAQIVVDLTPAAELWASVLPPVVPKGLLIATLVAVEPGIGGASHDHSEDLSDAMFFEHINPGAYRLRLRAGDRTLFESHVFALVAGQNRFPADGSRLDLRGFARAIQVQALDAESQEPLDDVAMMDLVSGAAELPAARESSMHDGWLVVAQPWHDVLITAPGYVPVRLQAPATDQYVPMQRMTTLRLLPRARSDFAVHIIEDGVRDLALRSCDTDNPHEDLTAGGTEPIELRFAPGTIVELQPVDHPVPPQRVVVGNTSPHEVHLR